jgi:hypothetical protein
LATFFNGRRATSPTSIASYGFFFVVIEGDEQLPGCHANEEAPKLQ